MGKKNTFKKLEKCVNKLVANGEKIVVLRFNNKSKCVDFRGSPELRKFAQGSLDQFLNEIGQTERPSNEVVPVGLPALQPGNISLKNLRKIVGSLISSYVLKEYGVKRGFWGLRNLAPKWYPPSINFSSPNDNKSGIRLSREECQQVVDAYKQFVLSGNSSQTGEILVKPQKRQADLKEEEGAAEEKKMKMESPVPPTPTPEPPLRPKPSEPAEEKEEVVVEEEVVKEPEPEEPVPCAEPAKLAEVRMPCKEVKDRMAQLKVCS